MFLHDVGYARMQRMQLNGEGSQGPMSNADCFVTPKCFGTCPHGTKVGAGAFAANLHPILEHHGVFPCPHPTLLRGAPSRLRWLVTTSHKSCCTDSNVFAGAQDENPMTIYPPSYDPLLPPITGPDVIQNMTTVCQEICQSFFTAYNVSIQIVDSNGL